MVVRLVGALALNPAGRSPVRSSIGILSNIALTFFGLAVVLGWNFRIITGDL